MEKKNHPSWIEIDLKQFKKNVSLIKAYLGKTLYCLPIKANAYGHGLCQIGRAAAEEGVDYLAVAHLQEGILLREAGIAIPILVMGALHENQIEDLIRYNLEVTLSSGYKADLVAAKCEALGQKCRVHLEIDTGMQRTGVRAESAKALYSRVKNRSCFHIIGIYSHLATADRAQDSFSHQQISHFERLKRDPLFDQPLIWHLANSGGTLFYPTALSDMARPALISFGYLPEQSPRELEGIAPCFSLKSKVSFFKAVPAGSGISYGHTYNTQTATRIVTVPIGYGDGYRRGLSNRASVLIRGKRYPIVGSICMDQFMVDIGDDSAYVGDEVVLIGKQGDQEITVGELASLCDTIPYEVLCFFNDRLPRVFV